MRITVEEQRAVYERVKILGMHCAACVVAVEERLRRLPGVRRVSVSLAEDEAFVEYEPSRTSLGDIVRAIRETGYDAYREEAVFTVPGLASRDDEVLVERRLTRTPGVVEARASHVSKKVYVVYNPLTVGVEDIRGALEEAGYRVGGGGKPGSAGAGAALRSLEALRRRLVVSAALALLLIVYERLGGILGAQGYSGVAGPVLAALVLAVGGSEFFHGAYRALRSGAANMDTLVSLGAGSAFLYSLAATLGLVEASDTYYDAASMIVVFVLLGRHLEARMKQRCSDAVRRLAALQPRTARVLREGREAEVPLSEVRVGDTVVVRQGERIPVDGVVVEGSGYVDESLVTGESMPVHRGPRSAVVAGSILVTGYLKVAATRVGGQTMLAQMIRLVELAQASKPPIQRLVDRVAGAFSWAVIGVALAVFAYWYLAVGLPLEESLVFMASVLLVSCPCALGLATPLVIAAGVGRLAEMGVIVRNAEALEKAAEADIVVFDKTGTLTQGKPRVVAVEPLDGHDREEVLRLAAAAEKRSSHPLARAIVEEAERRGIEAPEPESYDHIPGQGVVAKVRGELVGVGNERLAEGLSASLASDAKRLAEKLREQGATTVYVIRGNRPVGVIAVADEPRRDAAEAVEKLKRMGLRVIMLTGDNRLTAKAVAEKLGIDEVYAEAAPEEKVERIRELERRGHTIIMVGDGVNDAPSLAQADIGIAMGSGTDIAGEAGDLILVNNNLRQIPAIIELSRTIKNKIRLNLFWAFIYNTTLIPVAAGALYASHGLTLRPELAALAMALSSASITANALRLQQWNPQEKTPHQEGPAPSAM